MRRSLAPSQLAGPSKKPRLEKISTLQSKSGSQNAQKQTNASATSASFRSSQDILALLERKPCTNIFDEPQVHQAKQVVLSDVSKKNTQYNMISNTSGNEKTRYFSVYWCKASAKKHKNWEEEAVLVVQARAVILKSMEGKEIGQASGFKLAELQQLESGSTLKVGGREVLIQEQINEPSYLSKKEVDIVTKEPSLLAAAPVKSRTVANKNFVPPAVRSGGDKLPNGPGSFEIKPRHNPAAPSALVMPRPPSEIQWREAQKGAVIVDVVVDPLLCKHLRPHQREGVTFLYECLMGYKTPNMYGAVLADEMGLGKTLQCITVIWTLLNQGPFNGRPVVSYILVVAPSSLVKNWQKEFRRWLGRERLEVFTADQQNRPVEFWKQRISRVMVVSYEMFLRSVDEIQQVNFDLIVCDEGHRLKNSGNKTSSLLSQLNADRRILLTGTPVQNDLKEFYALADFVNPGIFGTLSSFRRTYEESILALQLPSCPGDLREAGENCAAELFNITSKFVLRRTQEVMSAHLPPKVDNVIFCRPSNAQIEMYHSLLDSGACRSLLTSSYSGNDLLGFIQTLRKLCNHPMLFKLRNEQAKDFSEPFALDLDDDSNDSCFDLYQKTMKKDYRDSASIEDSGKFLVTLRIVDSVMKFTREKIVLVSYSTKMLDLFGEACSDRKYGWLRLDGSTQATTRMSLVDRFNDPQGSERVFLLSSKAGGVGLNLIGASRLVLYDIDWNPANDLQAMARIWRDGQKRTVHIYRLLTTGTIEEKIFQRQVLKQGLSGAVVDSRDSSKGHFTKDELKDLFTLRKDTECDTHDLIQCKCSSEDEVFDGLPQREVQEAELNDERDCQLGALPTKGKEAHKTVDQLMDWRHYAPPFYEGAFEDDCMDLARDDITFVFRCTSGFSYD